MLLKIKDDISYERSILDGKTVRHLYYTGMSGDMEVCVEYAGLKYHISVYDIEKQIEEIPINKKGNPYFNGEFSTIIEKLSKVENPSLDLVEAVRVLQSMEKGIEYILDIVSVRKLAEIMNCCIEDITAN